MMQALDAGEFADRVWVNRLLNTFATYYFEAVESFEGDPRTCPPVWRGAFEACAEEGHHTLQLLILGINAHINYDLAFALADVMGDWPEMEEGARALRRADHDTVNQVIERTINTVQDGVVAPLSPGLAVVDRVMGPLDEWVFGGLISEWRDAVWDDAVALLEAGPTDRDGVRYRIEERALHIADRVSRIGPD
jgi:hypothetical protein